jgi:hypothetical protein
MLLLWLWYRLLLLLSPLLRFICWCLVCWLLLQACWGTTTVLLFILLLLLLGRMFHALQFLGPPCVLLLQLTAVATAMLQHHPS